MKCSNDEGRCLHKPRCEHACNLRVTYAPIKYETEAERVFYEGFKSLDDPTAPPGVLRFDGFASLESRAANFERDESNAEKLDNLTAERGVFRALLKEADGVLSTIEPDDTHEAGLLAQLRADIAKALT